MLTGFRKLRIFKDVIHPLASCLQQAEIVKDGKGRFTELFMYRKMINFGKPNKK